MNEELKQVSEVARDPLAYHWLTYLWVAVIAAWGGLVRFLNTIKNRKETIFVALCSLLICLLTSVFVGVMTFWACELAELDRLTTAILVAGTGFMGGESIRVFENGIKARLKLVIAAIFGGQNEPKAD
jgi:hypothetical protein